MHDFHQKYLINTHKAKEELVSLACLCFSNHDSPCYCIFQIFSVPLLLVVDVS